MSYKSYFSLCYDQDNERTSKILVPDDGTTDGVDLQSEYDGENSGCGGENGCCPINFDEIDRKMKELTPDD